ncbi:MAG: NAD(P)H-binding protein [FCB group bacterium]|nr:NAD(P)H-binding protein [FCB group bacterium]
MNVDQRPIVVFGGTGHYGCRIVSKLLDKQEKVRVLSRDSRKARRLLGENVDILEGDVTRRERIVQSLAGVKAIIICLSAMNRKLIRKMKSIERDAVLMILDEAQKARIDRLVYVSGYDLREDLLRELKMVKFGEIKLEIEKRIKSSRFDWTIIGAAPSFELFFSFINNDTMSVPGGGKNPIPTVSPEDIGEITAQAVLRTDLSGRRFRVTGPEALSFPEAVERISTIINREIKYRVIPLIIVKIAAVLTLPFHPFIRFIYWSVKLLNNFPADLATKVPEDHQHLLATFDYTPITFDMEIRNRFLKE